MSFGEGSSSECSGREGSPSTAKQGHPQRRDSWYPWVSMGQFCPDEIGKAWPGQGRAAKAPAIRYPTTLASSTLGHRLAQPNEQIAGQVTPSRDGHPTAGTRRSPNKSLAATTASAVGLLGRPNQAFTDRIEHQSHQARLSWTPRRRLEVHLSATHEICIRSGSTTSSSAAFRLQ
jgi:hypothetical protein